MNSNYETVLDETDLNELVRELEAEVDLDQDIRAQGKLGNKPCREFWKNVCKSWTKPKPHRQFVVRFQKLAGIISNKVVAVLILPNNQRVEFTELPHWKDVIRYKLAGFTYETYV